MSRPAARTAPDPAWDSNKHLSNRLAIGRLSGFKHGFSETDLIEHVIGNRLLCHRVGGLPDEPTIRRENPKRMRRILQFVLFCLVSAHLGSTRNALTWIFDDIGVLRTDLGQRLCKPQQLASDKVIQQGVAFDIGQDRKDQGESCHLNKRKLADQTTQRFRATIPAPPACTPRRVPWQSVEVKNSGRSSLAGLEYGRPRYSSWGHS